MMLSDVCLSRTPGLSPRTERPRKTKIGTEVGHVTRESDTTFKVKRSKVKVTRGGAYCGGFPHSLFQKQAHKSEIQTGRQKRQITKHDAQHTTMYTQ